ncbi:DNA/RNA helicase domain-containing protein [Sphingobacterium corticibacterium]|uniref:DUF2075 domain-containing protein n=1 Tax=Sphingobacterium corticibacterium TaxID=2484746 RepID=A0A4Q6XMN5_9SPHI|nr:DNA/RNA helicase domain-containing protein [Sphingobacterium corticibacterium]RZF61430.1 DUF2075 domain-containing protein [Sphingobacterium corticibacterium]
MGRCQSHLGGSVGKHLHFLPQYSRKIREFSHQAVFEAHHELIRAARVSVFFVDDFQAVRRGEIGLSSFIRMQAEKMGCTVRDC